MILRQIPNVLSIVRLVLIMPLLMSLYHHHYTAAFSLFIIAGFTDGCDGWLARRFQWQTTLGNFLDPFSDKLLIVTSFISLAYLNKLPWWLVIIVFLRDLTIMFGSLLLWLLFNQHIRGFKPTFLSKVNTAIQVILVTFCLFELAFVDLQHTLLNALILLTTLTTTASFIDYIWVWGKKIYYGHYSTT